MKGEIMTALRRRDFLKTAAGATLGAGLAAAATAPRPAAAAPDAAAAGRDADRLLPPPVPAPDLPDAARWAAVRDAFGLPRDYIHMNSGTTGSQPLFSLHNQQVYNRFKLRDPRDWEAVLAAAEPDLFPLVGKSSVTARQERIAGIYGADPDEIVLSYNTTDACAMIFAGTPWRPGDRIVTTTFEHPALAGPIAWARDNRGVEVTLVDIPSRLTRDHTVDDVLAWFEPALAAPRPRGSKQYLMFSEIFYRNGLRMPVAELCALARRHDAFTLVDTAHGWGMLPIDCHAYGADFIAGAGHKWLCGGPGTGILYARTTDADTHPLPPLAPAGYASYGNLFDAPSAFHDNRSWSPATALQGRGEINTPALLAMTDSAAFFDAVGVPDIYRRGVGLGRRLKDGILARWGSRALWIDPGQAAFATALTSFNPFAGNEDSARFAEQKKAVVGILDGLAAESPKIYIRAATWRSHADAPADDRIGLRVSTHAVYNSPDEVDHVLSRVIEHVERSGLEQVT
jgi:isopenicillin-N epimerase